LTIKGFIGTTLIDYPGHIACTVFTAGCRFRCPYCYNADLVLRHKDLPTLCEKDLMEDIENRIGFIDGVVVTGGEPTEQKGLKDFLASVKGLGLKTKIDTHGHEPEVLQDCLERDLLDFISMDFKASPDRYPEVVQAQVEWARIERSISLLLERDDMAEMRTTLHPKLHGLEDLLKMGDILGSRLAWAWQPVYPAPTLDPTFQVTDGEELEKYRSDLISWSQRFPHVRLSGLPIDR